jgi:hypothetical protein
LQDYLDAPIKYSFAEHPITRRELLTANIGYVIGLYLKQLGAPEVVTGANAREAADVTSKLIDKLMVLLGKPSSIIATVNATLPLEAVQAFLEKLGYDADTENTRPARVSDYSAGAQELVAAEPADAEFACIGDNPVPSVSTQGDTRVAVEAVPSSVAKLASAEPVHPDISTTGAREVNGVLGGI